MKIEFLDLQRMDKQPAIQHRNCLYTTSKGRITEAEQFD